ncbi:hypothetical protein [Prochlorococcus marinus]|uniref:Uncharacterized protein n=1 Tax=Prochlorococcus marinus (strain MIT 9211) TaxID=93059 RepID=A9BE55_PROM4|nr:hypothetical protein [Prochlorococcus marinus]ABX08365.1 hypothetical protein P9211_04341 [Prochlorococcus marinus str. MIT 9211]
MIGFKSLLGNYSFKNIFLWVVLLLMQSCSSSELEKKLSNSFDTPVAPNVTSTPQLKPKGNEPSLVSGKAKEVQKKEGLQGYNPKEKEIVQTNKIIFNSVRAKKTQKKNILAPFKPAPYRIIIKLSGANPSAPAETVTSALRDAGIIFEVEKIERFEEKSLLDPRSDKR